MFYQLNPTFCRFQKVEKIVLYHVKLYIKRFYLNLKRYIVLQHVKTIQISVLCTLKAAITRITRVTYIKAASSLKTLRVQHVKPATGHFHHVQPLEKARSKAF